MPYCQGVLIENHPQIDDLIQNALRSGVEIKTPLRSDDLIQHTLMLGVEIEQTPLEVMILINILYC